MFLLMLSCVRTLLKLVKHVGGIGRVLEKKLIDWIRGGLTCEIEGRSL